MQVKVLFARFPFGACDHPDTTDWLVETVLKAKSDSRISEVIHWKKDDTPIPMLRNRCLKVAGQMGVDLVCMIDSDMSPDLPGIGARPFWDSSLDFMLDHTGPCMVAAPYCGPPPIENVYVFRWAGMQSDHSNVDLKLEQFTREEAAVRGGFEEVGALPTGLCLIDMRALKSLRHPYFQYEYTDETQSEKASTEDVVFSRDLCIAGVPVYVNWDAWAGHWKRKRVGRPTLLGMDAVREQFREAVLSDRRSNERLSMMGPLTPTRSNHASELYWTRNGVRAMPIPSSPVDYEELTGAPD